MLLMPVVAIPVRFYLRAVVALMGLAGLCAPGLAEQEGSEIALAPHRAVYDLKLSQSRGKRSLEGVRGRIVYDFSGSACEGYGLQFRQVTELDNGEGKTAVSDLRSTTWEDGAAKTFHFNSQNFLNDELVESVDGEAERRPEGVGIRLRKPTDKHFDAGQVAFPTEQMRKILEAAHAAKSLLDLAVYDASENGEKVYQSLSLIGHKIPPEESKPVDAAGGQNALARLDRWPVTISYFDKAQKNGEQTPVYAISFELYDNGIARALVLDYGDFAVSGEMTSLQVKDVKPCH
jgi:EipB-like